MTTYSFITEGSNVFAKLNSKLILFKKKNNSKEVKRLIKIGFLFQKVLVPTDVIMRDYINVDLLYLLRKIINSWNQINILHRGASRNQN